MLFVQVARSAPIASAACQPKVTNATGKMMHDLLHLGRTLLQLSNGATASASDECAKPNDDQVRLPIAPPGACMQACLEQNASAEWSLHNKHRLSAFYQLKNNFGNACALWITSRIVLFHLGAVSTQKSPRRRVSDPTFAIAALANAWPTDIHSVAPHHCAL